MKNEIGVKLAKQIRRLRKKNNWTQEELAEYADIAVRQIQNLESLKNPPLCRINTLKKIADAFKITPSKLIDFKNN
ncbi:MAG TPA: helix-turn-helix transcriptional regulator [Verrucomicrobiae bacterium]|nr:helix-turn-helix transcriptional regulator [Verrucomicrobiae bacterium]